jgi:rhodanese-related sulfurtransferase
MSNNPTGLNRRREHAVNCWQNRSGTDRTKNAHLLDCTILVHLSQFAPIWCSAHRKRAFLPAMTHRTIINLPSSCLETTMNSVQNILAGAASRTPGAPYAGAVTVQEAMALLSLDPRAKLIDVRTNAERDWVGRVLVDQAQHGAVQWSTYPGGVPNPDFVAQLQQVAEPHDLLLFLCRSGVRSRHAAKLATEHGFARCYDILEGFEGDKDGAGHRKSVGGWCHAGLPWVGA